MTNDTPKIPAGSTDACSHPGCPIILRFKNATHGWRHSIVGSYDHEPIPATMPAAPARPAMPADRALALITSAVK